MPGVTMYTPVQLRTLHLWYDRTRTIGAPQHDMKHTMDTSCGTPWNTSTIDVPPGTIHPHLSRCSSAFTGLRSCFFSPAATLFFFSCFFYVFSFLAIIRFPYLLFLLSGPRSTDRRQFSHLNRFRLSLENDPFRSFFLF